MDSIDEELSKVLASNYRGLARVPLKALDFNHSLVQQKHRRLSQKNVTRLYNIFEKSNCLRTQEENFINAIVDAESLSHVSVSANITRDDLLQVRAGLDLPYLQFEVLYCLSGLHRVEAAKEFLDENDQWWVVRLFSDGMCELSSVTLELIKSETPAPILSRITELYSNEQKPSDGDIFRKIRLYHRQNESESENIWWTYLDHSKPKDLRQLIKKKNLTCAFDALIDMPGLWANVRLGALHRLLALKCEEEMIRYLVHIRKVWTSILACGNTKLDGSVVDAHTVETLELLCPKYSQSDKKTVFQMMQDRILFPSVSDADTRSALFANICETDTLIPSLRTFFETLKYLEPMCEIMKKLIGKKFKGSIRRSLYASFFPPHKMIIQDAENHFSEMIRLPAQSLAVELAYIQLWTFCGRHFNALTSFTPRKESHKKKPVMCGPNPVLWSTLAKFATDLGFRTAALEDILAKKSAHQLATDYLQKANPLIHDFTTEQVQAVVNASRAEATITEISETIDAELSVDRRTGRPYELDLEDDKRHLFFTRIYGSRQVNGISLMFVRQDLFRCLFGTFEILGTDLQPTTVQPTTAQPTTVQPSSLVTRKRRRGLEFGIDPVMQDIGDLQRQLAESKRRCAQLEFQLKGTRDNRSGYMNFNIPEHVIFGQDLSAVAMDLDLSTVPPSNLPTLDLTLQGYEGASEVTAPRDAAMKPDLSLQRYHGTNENTAQSITILDTDQQYRRALSSVHTDPLPVFNLPLQSYHEISKIGNRLFYVTEVDTEIYGYNIPIQQNTVSVLEEKISAIRELVEEDLFFLQKDGKWLAASSTAESIQQIISESETCFTGTKRILDLCSNVINAL